MKRELKPEEREEIGRAVAAGDRVKAISIYLSATEGDLTEAQDSHFQNVGRVTF